MAQHSGSSFRAIAASAVHTARATWWNVLSPAKWRTSVARSRLATTGGMRIVSN